MGFLFRSGRVSRYQAVLLSAGFLLQATGAHADRGMQAAQLLSYFGAGCPTQGEWTKTALSQTQSLIQVLQSVQQDPACQTLSGSLGQLNLLNSKLQSLAADPNELEIAALRAKQQEILLQLSITEDPGEYAYLRSMLLANQVDLAGYMGYQSVQDPVSEDARKGQRLQSVVLNVGVLLQQSLANQDCLIKHPSLLTGVASLAGSVSAASMTSGAALPIAAGVELLGSMVEYSRQSRLARRINALSDVVVSQAYQCVMESLSNQWCSAEDALGVVRMKAEALASPESNDPFLRGVRLLDRQLPSVLKWLDRVRSGTEPTNQASADRQARTLEREKLVRSSRVLGLGTIAESKVLFDTVTSADKDEADRQRWIILRSMIKELVDRLTGGMAGSIMGSAAGVSNPLAEIYDSSYAPYYLLGLSRAQAPLIEGLGGVMLPFDNFDPFAAWPPGLGAFQPDIVMVRSRMLTWLAAAQDVVSRELGVVMHPDPLQILSEAATRDIHGMSPYDSMIRLMSFLRTAEPKSFVVGSHRILYRETVARMEQITEKIRLALEQEAVPTDETDPLHPKSVLAFIYQKASLDHGVGLLGGRLERSIRLSLNDALLDKKSGSVDASTAARLLAADDLLNELERFSGSRDLNLITRDIENSQVMLQRSLQTFTDTFGDGIAKVIGAYWTEARRMTTPNGPYPKAAKSGTELCLKLLASPVWPRAVPKSVCEGVFLRSVFRNGPSSVTVSRAVMDSPFSERACHYRNWLRSNKIYQDYLERNAP